MTHRRFVIGVEGLNSDQERCFQEYLAAFGSWWHWIGNLWLLTTEKTDITAHDMLRFAMSLNKTSRAVVFEFPEDLDWVASGKTLSNWLRRSWGDA